MAQIDYLMRWQKDVQKQTAYRRLTQLFHLWPKILLETWLSVIDSPQPILYPTHSSTGIAFYYLFLFLFFAVYHFFIGIFSQLLKEPQRNTFSPSPLQLKTTLSDSDSDMLYCILPWIWCLEVFLDLWVRRISVQLLNLGSLKVQLLGR